MADGDYCGCCGRSCTGDWCAECRDHIRPPEKGVHIAMWNRTFFGQHGRECPYQIGLEGDEDG